jgi:uncharacterized protein YecE (DUF72 family)
MSRNSPHDRQMNLFGAVGAVAVSEELGRIATALPPGIRLGTSSWSFPGWEGLVYDRAATKHQLARNGLAAYARHPLLRAVGIDRTFYAPIPAAAFAEYAQVVPCEFRFLVKACNLCTTPRERGTGAKNPLFLERGFAASEVVAPYTEGLGEKAGALLFQFPPLGRSLETEPAAFADRLCEFVSGLPPGPTYAVEVRDAALICDSYFDALAAAGASHCFSVHPRLPSIDEQRRRAAGRAEDPLVGRWMLRPGLDYEQAVERYEPFSRIVDADPGNIGRMTELCVEATLRGRQVLITANNKAEGSAPGTVFRLAESVGRRLSESDRRQR